jgi:hypothetical protein
MVLEKEEGRKIVCGTIDNWYLIFVWDEEINCGGSSA